MPKLANLNETLGKHCLVALSYFDAAQQPLKQSLLAGKVIAVDKEQGITLTLFSEKNSAQQLTDNSNELANLIIPAELSCWFTAPQGDFHTSQKNVKITNPDFLVTWDIHQTKANKKDGEQQWWQWLPKTAAPIVN